MAKKIIPLIILTSLLSSCSLNSSKAVLGKCFVSYISNENNVLKADIESVSRTIAMDAGFAIYISEKGCSACETFNPILTSYVEKTSLLTYQFDVEENREDLAAFQLFYGDRFFKKNSSGDYIIETPSLYVVYSNTVNEVNRDSYMKTNKAFENYMDSKYNIKNHFFIHEDISKYDVSGKSFSLVSYNKDKQDVVSVYKTKLLPLINLSDNTIIVSDASNEEVVSISKYEDGSIIQTKTIDSNSIIDEI